MQYKLLATQNPDYQGALFSELEDFYVGGYQAAANAKRYLPKLVGETSERFEERCALASYVPYLGQVVDQLASWLFKDGLSVQPASSKDGALADVPDEAYYAQLAENADGMSKGVSFEDVLIDATRTALVKGHAFVGVDFPRLTLDASSLADEDAAGARNAYIFSIPVEQAIDWSKDDHGALQWMILRRCFQERTDPSQPRGDMIEEFKIWRIADTGRAVWQTFRVAWVGGKPPDPGVDIPLFDEGATSFRSIPIVGLELPPGLWVGNKIGVMCREHFQRRSALVASEYKSLVSVPVAKLGSEVESMGGGVPSEAQENPGRGDDVVGQFRRRGYVVLGRDDSFEFAEPTGAAYEIVDRQLDALKDEIFRVVHMMASSVSNTAGHMGRSGISKQKDGESTVIVLGAIGELVRSFGVSIYDLISRTRGEVVKWTATGLDQFEMDQRDAVLAEATSIDQIDIPSVTFKREHKTHVAFQLLPDLDPRTKAIIRNEIHEGVAAEADLMKALAPDVRGPDADDAAA